MSRDEGEFNSLESGTPRGSWVLPSLNISSALANSPLPLRRSSRLQPLTIKGTIQEFYTHCFKLLWINTYLGFLCFFGSVPYMVWAAYAGNYASLVKGVHVTSASRTLEGVDTLFIGAVGILGAPVLMHCLFDAPIIKKVLLWSLVAAIIGVIIVIPFRYVLNIPDLYIGVLYGIAAIVCVGAPFYVRETLKQPKLPLFLGVPFILIVVIHFVVDYTIVPAFAETSADEFRILIRVLLSPVFFGCIISVVRPLSRNITGVKGMYYQTFPIIIHSFDRACFGRLFTYELNNFWYIVLASLIASGGVFLIRLIFWNRNKIITSLSGRVAPSPFPPAKFVDAFLVYNDPGDEYYAVYLNIERYMETAAIFGMGFLKILSVVAYTHPLQIHHLHTVFIMIAIQLGIEILFQTISIFTEIYNGIHYYVTYLEYFFYYAQEIPVINFVNFYPNFIGISLFSFFFGSCLLSWKALYMMRGMYLVSL